jgi:hypothetical protein
MSRFLRTLAKVGLVELEGAEQARAREDSAGLSDEQLARILAEEAAAAQAVTPPPLPPPVAPQGHEGEAFEAASFEDLYREAQVPSSPFPAEKLLKLLDGLRAMDPATRKAAVLAMDAADDAWTIDDALLDAERKGRTLKQGMERLSAGLGQAEERAKAELHSLDGYAQKAADTIRKQIAELEQLLQQELEAAAQKKAQVQTDLRLAREAVARERTRYEQEVTRLAEVAGIFGPAEAHKPHAG